MSPDEDQLDLDVLFMRMALRQAVKAGEAVSVVDSVKAASDAYSPVSGTVSAINGALDGAPELVNSSAESDGWLFKLTLGDAGELAALMDKAAYDVYVAGL